MTETNIAPVLVSILLLSVVAPGSAVAETTAVGHDGGELHHTTYEFDANLSTGSVHWQGQQLYLQGAASDREYELHTVDGSGDDRHVGEFVQTVALDENASAVIDTGSLDTDEYVLVDESGQLVRTDDSGVQTGTASTSDSDAIGKAAITLTEQSLSATAEQDSATPSEYVDFVLESNRGAYAVEITSGGFTSGELQDLFGGSVTDDGTRVEVTDGLVTADLAGVDTGAYTFTFDVTDVPVESTATIAVSEPDEMQLTNDTVRAATGDVATIELTMESGDGGTLVVGTADKGYRATVGFEDDDNDGHVSLGMNTYLAGNHTGGGEDAAWSTDDGDTVTGVELTTASLDEPLAATGYDIQVRAEGTQRDYGLLALEDPSLSGLTLWTAPERHFRESLSDTTKTQTDRVAVEDVLIAEVNGQGLFGLLETQPGDHTTERFRSLVYSADAAFDMRLDDRWANGDPDLDLRESFQNDAFHVISDRENGTLYVTMDEEALRFEDGRNKIQPDDSYQVVFKLDANSGLVPNDEHARATVQFTERSATIETGEADRLWLPATDNATITGSTTIAPGSRLDLRVRLDGIVRHALTTTVQSDRTFAAPVDLSDTADGTNVTVSFRDFETAASGVVDRAATDPEPPTTPTTEPPVTTTDRTTSAQTDETPTETIERTDRTTTTDETVTTAATASNDPPTTTGQVTSGSGPGFGVTAAALAVLGVAVLATRRRSN